MKDELQYQRNMGYVGKLLKLRYDNAMRLWGEMQCNSTLYYSVNLTTGIMEEYESTSALLQEETIGKSYQKLVQWIVHLIEDEEERELAQRTLNREHLVELFEQGEVEVDIEYRRKFGNKDFRWMKCQIKMVLEPAKMQIIGFGIEREIPQTWTKKTISKALLNRLYCATNKMYFCVLAMNYKAYSYDTIQANHVHKGLLPLKGSVGTLIDDMHKIYHENSYAFLELLRDGDSVRNELIKKKKFVWEVQVQAKHKRHTEYIWFEHRVLSVEENPKDCNYFLLLTVDITERKAREEALKEALAKSEQAGRAKQFFLSHISHEIRTPLNGIMGMMRLIQDEPGMERNEYLKNAMISSKHLKILLNDILDMARIECGKVNLHKSWVMEPEFFSYINAMIEPLAREKEIHFFYHHRERFQAIYIDIGKLQQIVINLLTNAIKYNHKGGTVTLSINTQLLYDNYEKVIICVEDNGRGMSKKFQKKAFDPFEQEESSDTRSGTGLGLTIVKLLVTLMGGTITINSKLNVGTKITVTIEAQGSNDYKKPDAGIECKEMEDTYQEKHCLLVDDNEMNREIVAIYLKEMGIFVDAATGGLDAVEFFAHAKEGYYDIIFMDIVLPDMSGLQVANKIRNMQRKDAKQIPIVALTANSFSEDIRRIYDSGMNDYLLKPFDKKELQTVVMNNMQSNVEV